jgi:UDP-N-acetylmuramate--alanine ligase
MATPNTHYGAKNIAQMLAGARSIFFAGIGGVNMSSLALISKLRGFKVGGSDTGVTDVTRALEASGITVFHTHDAANLEGYDAMVYTVAISPENPEYKAALMSGIPCISRADYLGYVMMGYQNRLGVSGMHGKSTCTSMCALAYMEACADPTVLSGARLDAMGGAYRIGGEEFFIFEACEYMDSFLDFNPTTAIILNIEMDHVDYFKSMTQIRRSYSNFAAITGADGCCIYNSDDENVRLVMHSYVGKPVSFALKDENADYRAVNISVDRGRPAFDVCAFGEIVAHVDLSVCGNHNIYNALAAFAAAHTAGLDAALIARGLSRFTGAGRRMEYKGSVSGAAVYDDYGHHPTEVATTLDGFRQMGYDRMICVFQPHTYSRTAELFSDFATALDVADKVVVAEIYAAREVDTLGVSAQKLAAAIGEKAVALPSFEAIAEYIRQNAREGDLVVVMGAGDIYKVFPLLDLK